MSSGCYAAASLSSLNRPEQKNDEDRMGHNCRPQEQSNRFSTDTDVHKVQHRKCAVGQHSVQWPGGRVARPAADTQADQGDTGDTAHYDADAAYLYAKQEANHKRRPRQQKQSRTRFGSRRQREDFVLHATDSSLLLALHLELYLGFRLLHDLAAHLLDQFTPVLVADGLELLLLLLIQERSELGIDVVGDFLQLL